MARLEVLARSLIGLRVYEPGDIVELDPKTTVASANLRPLDADAAEMRSRQLERFAELAPPGSAADNERRRLAKTGQRLGDHQVDAMYRKRRPSSRRLLAVCPKQRPGPRRPSSRNTWE